MKKQKLQDLINQLEKKERGRLTDIDGIKREFKIGNFVVHRASEYPDKVFVLQEIIKDWKTKDERGNCPKLLRFAYYIIGKKPKLVGKWVFGQYNPFITCEDLKKLIAKAEKKGII